MPALLGTSSLLACPPPGVNVSTNVAGALAQIDTVAARLVHPPKPVDAGGGAVAACCAEPSVTFVVSGEVDLSRSLHLSGGSSGHVVLSVRDTDTGRPAVVSQCYRVR